MDVGAWLRSLGLGQYEQAFRDNAVDEHVLPDLTAEDLKDLGVVQVGDRRKLLSAIVRLQAQVVSPAATPQPQITEEVPQAERRQLTILFCDLVGSTALSARLDPEDLRDMIAAYQRCVAEAVARFNGFVAKYMGDGVLVYFGYPQAHEEDAEDAVRAGLAVIEAVERLRMGDGLSIRVGIATGLVVVGDLIGTGDAQERGVVGETPNLAARLQALAEPGSISIDASTRRLTGDLFEYANLGLVELKGFAKPIQVSRVVRESTVRSRFEALHGAASLTPLVGREEELELLLRRWHKARSGEGQVVLILGEPGIGKSRLIAALEGCLGTDTHPRLHYYCSPHHRDSAFFPIISQLEHAAGLERDDPRDMKIDKLEALLCLTSASGEDVALLAGLLSIPAGHRLPSLDLTPQQRRERAVEAVLRQVNRLSHEKPVLMVFEDVQWIDPTSRELLDVAVERAQHLSVLLIITFRPEFQPPWTSHAHVTTLILNRLESHEGAALVQRIAGGRLPSVTQEAIVQRADGIPLFVEELTKTALEAGDAEPKIPETLQASLLARLDRLGPVKHVAQVGAVIGREFDHALLVSAINSAPAELLHSIDHLIASQLVYRQGRPPNITYVFKHALIQQAAYESLLKSRRRALHGDVAQALLQLAPEHATVLAHHWERAENLERAFACRVRAAEQNLALYAIREANAEYWSALGLLDRMARSPEAERRRIEILLAMMAWGYFWRGDAERSAARRHLDKAIEAATEQKDWPALARLKAYTGSYWDDETLLLDAVDDATKSGDKATEAAAVEHCAAYFGKHGLFGRALWYIERATQLFDDLDEKLAQGDMLAGVGRCFYARAGRLDDAFRCAHRAREIAEQVNNPRLSAAMPMEAEVFFYKGLWKDVVDVVQSGIAPAWTTGAWDIIMWTYAWAAIAYLKLGSPDDAARLMGRTMSEVIPKVGYDFPKIYLLIALGQVQLAQGDASSAVETGRHALALAEGSTMPLEQGAAHRALAQAYEQVGDGAEATAHYRNSIAALGAIDSPPELAQSLLAYGRFLSQSNAEAGREHLERALTLFVDLDATGWIEEAHRALSAVSCPSIGHHSL